MVKNNARVLVQTTAVAAILLSFWFVYSVIMNARDLIEHGIKNAPASYALILCLILLAYSWYRNDKKITIMHVVTLTILATTVVIWVAGLSAQPMQ